MNLIKRKKMFVMNRGMKQTLSKEDVKVEKLVQKAPEQLPVALKELDVKPVVEEVKVPEAEPAIVEQAQEIKEEQAEVTKQKKNKKVVEKEEEV